MEMRPAPPDADETLAAIGHRIYRSFGSLELDCMSRDDDDAFSSTLVNESQRFCLWAKNTGLHDLGHSSLDYRLRDAPVVSDYTNHLLVDLEKSIWKIHQDLDQRKPGWKIVAERPRSPGKISEQAARTSHDYDEDQGSDESSEDEETLMSYQEDSISNLVLENAKLIVDRLYKLSFKIRDPETRLGFSKAKSYREIIEETGVDLVDWDASFDLRHIAETIAQYWRRPQEECESHYLVQRLARANTHRRRQFRQWRRHKLKLESAEEVFAQTMENNVILNDNMNDNTSVNSSSAYGILFREDDVDHVKLAISIPPLPENLCTGKEFECPYCHVLCSKRTSERIAWERHVIRDLRPYVCTYENCKEADQQYGNIVDWVSHETDTHRDMKLRPASPSEQPSDHDVLSQPSKLVTLNDTCRQECPVCLESDPSFFHVGRHLQRFAVFALPRSTGAENEVSMKGTDSKAPTDGNRNSLPATVVDLWDGDGKPSSCSSTGGKIGFKSTASARTALNVLNESTEDKKGTGASSVFERESFERDEDQSRIRSRRGFREEDFTLCPGEREQERETEKIVQEILTHHRYITDHGFVRAPKPLRIRAPPRPRSPSPAPFRTEPIEIRQSDSRTDQSYDEDIIIQHEIDDHRVLDDIRHTERLKEGVHEVAIKDKGGSLDGENFKKNGMRTQVTKDLISEEAIKELGYDFEEIDECYHVMEFLSYEDVNRLVELTEDIKRDRRERIREIQAEREFIERPRRMLALPPASLPWEE